MPSFRNPDFGQFRLGDAVIQGQQIAEGNYRLGEVQRGQQARNALESAIRTGDTQNFQQQFPIEAQQYQQAQQTASQQQERLNLETQANKLKILSGQLDMTVKLLSTATDDNSWKQNLDIARQNGLPVDNVPPNFDPQFRETMLGQSLTAKDRIELQLKHLDLDLKAQSQAETKRKNLAEERLKASEIGQGGKPPAGYRWTPEGGLAPIPGGPADPKTKSAKMTDTELTAAGYATRMTKAEEIMSTIPAVDQKPGVGESIGATLPGVGKLLSNVARSDERQKYRQAQEDWVRAKLRKESGAVIADEEMDREIRVYFPQLGDSDAVIEQKKAARQISIEAMEKASGPSYEKPTTGKKVVRTGMLNGNKVVQYDDGTVDYAP